MAEDMKKVLIDKTLPVRPRVLNDSSAAPWGLLNHDRGALSGSQQHELNCLKTSFLRRGNRHYLYSHPQVTAVATVILRAVYLHRPKEPKKFIADLVERSDFEDKVRYCLSKGGPQPKQGFVVDLYSCIIPELLTNKEGEEEKEAIHLNMTDDECVGKESSYPTDSADSIDSIRMFSAIGDEAGRLEKRLDENYRRTEELARKVVNNEMQSGAR